jgi:hypothetical protein
MSRVTTNSGPTTLVPAGGNVPARAQTRAPSRLQGEEAEDTIFPRIHIFQGLPAEKEIYGKHEDGDLINTLSGETLTTKAQLAKKRFVPVFGWVEYIKFRTPRGSGIEYRERDKRKVPAADLVWDRQSGRPPAATKIINWVCLFEGVDAPVVMSFKSTNLKTGQTINTLENGRPEGKPGFYALDLQQRKNSKGAWLHPAVRPAGDPPADLAAKAATALTRYNPDTVSTNLDDAPDVDEDEEAAASAASGRGFDPNAEAT